MKVEEYIANMFQQGTDQTGKCDIKIFKSVMFCPQCPHCSYIGSIPGKDFELNSSTRCDSGYFPYCKSKSQCSANHWLSNDECNDFKKETSYELVDPVRQNINFEDANMARQQLTDCLRRQPQSLEASSKRIRGGQSDAELVAYLNANVPKVSGKVPVPSVVPLRVLVYTVIHGWKILLTLLLVIVILIYLAARKKKYKIYVKER